MAEKRMLNRKLVTSDAFLDMPPTSQLLYFHLNLSADDDGFIDSPRMVMRLVNSSDDDIKILLAKRYLLLFDSGIYVIKHWWLHNQFRKDRHKPTVYTEEMLQLVKKTNGSYTEKQNGNQVATSGLPSIDKNRLDKISIEESNIPPKEDEKPKPRRKSYGKYKRVKLFKEQYDDLLKLWGKDELERMITLMDMKIEEKGYKYENFSLALQNWRKKDFNNNKSTDDFNKGDGYGDLGA